MTRPPVDSEFAFDPMDQSRTQDFDLMAQIRREKPICRPADGVVLTTRYADTREVFCDAQGFSSAGDMRAPGFEVPIEESFMGELDAPYHTRVRRVLARDFTRRGALAAEDWTRRSIRRRLDALAARDEVDLMNDFAILVPGSVSAHVMGIPETLHEPLMSWCNDLLHSSWPATGKTERGEGIELSFPELSACIDGLIREREEAGEAAPPGLITTMVQATDEEGRVISAHHARTLVINMLAGSLSASFMLGNLLHRWITDPEFERTLREQPELIPAAVDESLRLEAPVTFLFRKAKSDKPVGGCPVHQGEQIMLGIAAANRDDAVYPDAENFRLDRHAAKAHLAFGIGPHVCLGNHLTWMIGRVVLEEFAARFAPGQIRPAVGYEWVCVDHIQEYGPEHLLVSFDESP
jgi:cytochrome P450